MLLVRYVCDPPCRVSGNHFSLAVSLSLNIYMIKQQLQKTSCHWGNFSCTISTLQLFQFIESAPSLHLFTNGFMT